MLIKCTAHEKNGLQKILTESTICPFAEYHCAAHGNCADCQRIDWVITPDVKNHAAPDAAYRVTVETAPGYSAHDELIAGRECKGFTLIADGEIFVYHMTINELAAAIAGTTETMQAAYIAEGMVKANQFAAERAKGMLAQLLTKHLEDTDDEEDDDGE